jgi:hypothetical protein
VELKEGQGDLAELKVARDLRTHGYKIAFPYGQQRGVRLAERYAAI